MQVYVYQGNLYCKDCGETIQENLAEIDLSPAHPDMEDTYDSDEFPKGPYSNGGGESDYPQHCGAGPNCVNAIELSSGRRIGVWLENPLTLIGVEYVQDEISREGLSGFVRGLTASREVVELWAEYYADVLDD